MAGNLVGTEGEPRVPRAIRARFGRAMAKRRQRRCCPHCRLARCGLAKKQPKLGLVGRYHTSIRLVPSTIHPKRPFLPTGWGPQHTRRTSTACSCATWRQPMAKQTKHDGSYHTGLRSCSAASSPNRQDWTQEQKSTPQQTLNTIPQQARRLSLELRRLALQVTRRAFPTNPLKRLRQPHPIDWLFACRPCRRTAGPEAVSNRDPPQAAFSNHK